MTTTRVSTAIAAAIVAAISLIAVPGPAFADPAKPAPAPAADKKADKPAPTPAPAGDKKVVVSDAEAKRFVEFFDKLVAVVVTNQGDCAKMATAVNGHIDGNQALVKEIGRAHV